VCSQDEQRYNLSSPGRGTTSDSLSQLRRDTQKDVSSFPKGSRAQEKDLEEL